VIQPGSPLVLIRWLATLGLPCDGIGDHLPADPTTWATQGFLQVPMTVGGSPDVDVPMRAPVVQVDAYTNRPDSERAPWNRAEHLAASVLAAAQDQRTPVDLVMPASYYPARLHSVWANTEPRRIPGDPSGFARVTCDYQMRWVVLR
jgi:hypothetical protein